MRHAVDVVVVVVIIAVVVSYPASADMDLNAVVKAPSTSNFRHAARADPGSSRRARTHMTLAPRVLYLEHCEDKRNCAYISNFTSLLERHGVMLFNAVFDVRVGARSISMMKVILHRCRDAISSNTCEYFATWPFQVGVCQMMLAKGMMWSGFMAAARPPFSCPIKTGVYHVENGTFDVANGETIANIKMGDNVWKVDIHFYNEARRFYSCIKTAVHVRRVAVMDDQ